MDKTENGRTNNNGDIAMIKTLKNRMKRNKIKADELRNQLKKIEQEQYLIAECIELMEDGYVTSETMTTWEKKNRGKKNV